MKLGSVSFALVLAALGRLAVADVALGDVITAANEEQVRELVPPEFYSYAIEPTPELEMRTVETAMAPGLAVAYDRGGKPFKRIGGVGYDTTKLKTARR